MAYSDIELEKINWTIANRMRGTIKTENVYPLVYLAHCALQDDAARYDIQYAVALAARGDSDIEVFLQEAAGQLTGARAFEDFVLCVDSLDQKLVIEYLKRGPFNQGIFSLEHATPQGVAALAQAILDIQPGERVIDYGCGQGNFLELAAVKQPKAYLQGVDINLQAIAAAKIRAAIAESPIDYTLGDMFWYHDGRIAGNPVDKAFSNYPWGVRTKMLQASSDYIGRVLKGQECYKRPVSADWVFNRLLVDSIKEEGIAVAIMSNGATFNGADMPVRKYFVDNGFIKAVVALPKGMFGPYTSIETSLIVLCAGGAQSVRFIDATDLGEKDRRSTRLGDADIAEIVDRLKNDSEKSGTKTIDEIAARSYDLSAKRFLQPEIEIVNSVDLAELCKDITRGAAVRAAELDALTCHEDTGTSYLNLGDISDGYVNDDLPNLKSLDSKMAKYCIHDGDVLLSKTGVPFKVAVAEVPEGRRILANGNLYVISVDKDKVDPHYLAAYLASPTGKELLARITVGTTIPSIPIKSLSALQVPMTDMKHQKEIGTAYLSKIDEIKVLKLRLQQARQEITDLFEG